MLIYIVIAWILLELSAPVWCWVFWAVHVVAKFLFVLLEKVTGT